MKAPSLLVQCFPGLLPSKATSCVPIVSERDLHLPSPAVEIIPSKSAHPYKYAGEKVDVQGLDIFKCLRPPYGVLYLASKKNLVGSNGSARQLRALMEEEGVLGGHFLTEVSDREIWKFFFK